MEFVRLKEQYHLIVPKWSYWLGGKDEQLGQITPPSPGQLLSSMEPPGIAVTDKQNMSEDLSNCTYLNKNITAERKRLREEYTIPPIY